MKLLRGAAAVALVTIVAGATPSFAKAPSKPLSSSWQQAFDTSQLPQRARAAAEEALSAFDFDWTKLLPAMGGRKIVLAVADLSSYGAVGAAWPAPVGRIELDDDVVGHPIWVKAVMLHELGHIVDFYYLEPRGLHDDVAALYGQDWDVIAHSFNAAFVAAFTGYEMVDDAFPLSGSKVRELRRLLSGAGAGPSTRAASPHAGQNGSEVHFD